MTVILTPGAVLAVGAAAAAEPPRILDVIRLHAPAADVIPARREAPAPLGGISDLFARSADDGSMKFWAVTDRGPNGTVTTPSAGRRRTLLDPAFVPKIVSFTATIAAGSTPAARIAQCTELCGRSGRPLSGRPNGIGNDEPILDATGSRELPADPNGVDTEGLVRLGDGSFWLAEEYRPSLLHVAGDGRVRARFVPRGHSLPGADMEVFEVLPAEYGSRKDNRGFEALAVSPDEATLWAVLQSPLDHPVPGAGKKTGNVRLLAFDLRSRRPATEYVYRLGDPDATGYETAGAAPADGKLCAMAAIDGHTLLVLEQSGSDVVRVYRCGLAGATDTLPRSERGSGAGPALETIGDLAAAGIVPIEKRLVADLAPLRGAMLRDVYGEEAVSNGSLELKLEGMAILSADRIAVVNDNDFGLNAAAETSPMPGTCLWILGVHTPHGTASK